MSDHRRCHRCFYNADVAFMERIDGRWLCVSCAADAAWQRLRDKEMSEAELRQMAGDR